MFFKLFVTVPIIIFTIYIICINTYSVFAVGTSISDNQTDPTNDTQKLENASKIKDGERKKLSFIAAINTTTILDLKGIIPHQEYYTSDLPKKGKVNQLDDGFKWSYTSFSNFTGKDNFTLVSNTNASTDPVYDIMINVTTSYKPKPLPYTTDNTIIRITTDNNTITVIDLKGYRINENYIISSYPKNGTVEKIDDELKWSYISFPNFIGKDNFTLVSNTNASTNPVYDIMIEVQFRKAFTPIWPFSALSQDLRFATALMVAFVVVLAIIVFVWRLTWKSIYEKGDLKYEPKFSDFIRTPDWDPSLSIFQFLLWTTVVIFTYLSLYLFRIFNGVSEPPQGGIPTNLLLLMGISIGVPIASSYISSVKRGPGELTDVPPKVPRPRLSLMLYEFDKLTLSRFQMFAWTWVSILIYLYAFIPAVTDHFSTPQNATVPNIDPTLVAFMGLSQAAFLAGKAANPKLRISSIYPEVGRVGERISIFGSNFGNNKDIIWFNDRAIKTEGLEDVSWLNGERIDLTISEEDITSDLYSIRVSNGGVLSEPFKPSYMILPKGEQQQKSGDIKYFRYPPPGMKVKSNVQSEIVMHLENILIDKESFNNTNVSVTKIDGIENLVNKERISVYNNNHLVIPLKKLEPNSKYSVKIGKDVKIAKDVGTREDRTIGVDIIWEFETE
jgi:hypothetical protein